METPLLLGTSTPVTSPSSLRIQRVSPAFIWLRIGEASEAWRWYGSRGMCRDGLVITAAYLSEDFFWARSLQLSEEVSGT